MTSARIMAARLLPEGRLMGPMPWVIAIMMFLTVLSAAAGLAIGGATQGLGDAIAGRLTVQIVEANPVERERQRIAAIAELNRMTNVVDIAPVDDAALRDLLAPWLGRDGLERDLPVPALVDATLKDGSPRALAELTREIALAAPAARVDRHADWLQPLAGLLTTLQRLAIALVVLVAVATAASVALGARSALDMHRQTIDVMHLMGATDSQIARLFERRVALDALFGSFVGGIAGLAVLLLLRDRMGALGSALPGSGSGFAPWQWLVMALLPLAAVGIALLTARLTVLRALARIL